MCLCCAQIWEWLVGKNKLLLTWFNLFVYHTKENTTYFESWKDAIHILFKASHLYFRVSKLRKQHPHLLCICNSWGVSLARHTFALRLAFAKPVSWPRPPKEIITKALFFAEPDEVHLRSDERAKQREKFDEFLVAQSQERQAHLQRLKDEDEQKQLEEIKQLRKDTVHKAGTIRHYKTVEVRKSDRKLTTPLSPQFSDRFKKWSLPVRRCSLSRDKIFFSNDAQPDFLPPHHCRCKRRFHWSVPGQERYVYSLQV